MNITREQMLEFFDGILCRLDYEYTRTPLFKQMTAAIESLIEASGDKANENKGAEKVLESGPHAEEPLVKPAAPPSPAPSPAVPASDRLTVPCENAPTIKQDLRVGPSVEEAMGTIHHAFGDAYAFRRGDVKQHGASVEFAIEENDKDLAALAVIRAALSKGIEVEP